MLSQSPYAGQNLQNLIFEGVLWLIFRVSVKIARGITQKRIFVTVKSSLLCGVPDAVFGPRVLNDGIGPMWTYGGGYHDRDIYPFYSGYGGFDYRREEDLHNPVGTEGCSW
ncbi:MAG TPA: hypothetical protein O0Y06_03875 [Methanocorpusculum sp.]|nr:hypothetical protein [Methanocorpusculum sp.]